MDGQSLLVVESTRPGVVRIPIDAAGDAGPPEVVACWDSGVPDGIAVAGAGALYVSCYRPDRIYRVDTSGRISVFADDPSGQSLNAPANVCFAGPALDLLVASNLGGWHLTALAVAERGHPVSVGSIQ
jgi:gluconolactonase